jgi:hypothetical protein
MKELFESSYLSVMSDANLDLRNRISKAIEILKDDNIKFSSAKEWRDNLINVLEGKNNE